MRRLAQADRDLEKIEHTREDIMRRRAEIKERIAALDDMGNVHSITRRNP